MALTNGKRGLLVLFYLLAIGVGKRNQHWFVHGEDNVGCIDDLESILLTEIDVVDFVDHRTYVLCPDTTFTIGHNAFGSVDSESPGQWPLFLFRPNITVSCGVTGSSEGKCVFTGQGNGEQNPSPHVVVGRPFSLASNREGIEYPSMPDIPQSDEEDDDFHFLENVIVRGITFRGVAGNRANVAIYSGAHLTIQDCIFEENDTPSVIFAIDGDSDTRAPFQQNDDDVFLDDNHFDFAPSHPITVNVRDCLFRDNTGFVEGGGTAGLISMMSTSFVSVTMNIEESKFTNNRYGQDASANQLSTVILLGDSDTNLHLKDSCFVGDVVLIAPIVANNGAKVETSNLFLSDIVDSICREIASVSNGNFETSSFDDLSFNCIDTKQPAAACPLDTAGEGNDSGSDNSPPECKDNADAAFKIKVKRDDKWSCQGLKDGDDETRKWHCNRAVKVKKLCPALCGECAMFDESCQDEEFGEHRLRLRRTKDCLWLSNRNANRKEKLCERESLRANSLCPKSCGTCMSEINS